MSQDSRLEPPIVPEIPADRIRRVGDPDLRRRLGAHLPTLAAELQAVYGDDPRLPALVRDLVELAVRSHAERSPELRQLDRDREAEPFWFQSERMLGGFAYADRFAGTLSGMAAEIPYLREIGLTYLHLMPFFRVPPGNSDGGYAVSSYRHVDPRLGTMEDLERLAGDLRRNGISLSVDFVFNHTASDHEWARRAMAGEREFQDRYWIFPDRRMPDIFEETTREIFPDDHPGSFVELPDGRWIWATFHSFQWDLNYSNPAVFRAMAEEMLFLANRGVEILRMDAVAFIWKRVGTTCESLPEAHRLLRAFNAVCRIAAPAMVFLSEAIVHPDEVATYVDAAECPLSYNPLVMALGWEAVATRDASLLQQAMDRRQSLPEGCAWVNYVRSHDDIGWTFADEEAAELGIDGFEHRRFLNRFFVGRFEGSFARGLPFQENPRTGDCRIAGTTAALAGLAAGDEGGVGRVVLLYSIALAAAGIPLLYLGDEVGQLNDPTFRDRPAEAGDTRWAHRPFRPGALYREREREGTAAHAIFGALTRLIRVRQATAAFGGGASHGFWTGDRHVLGFLRPGAPSVVVLANVSDDPRTVAAERFAAFADEARDLAADRPLSTRHDLVLPPHGFAWLAVAPREASGRP